MLQAYATQRILDEAGIANETLDISRINTRIRMGKLRYYIMNLFNLQMYRAKKGFVRLAVKKKCDRTFRNQAQVRSNAFRQFRNACFHLSPAYRSFRDLTGACSGYSDILVGSDQLWLPVNIEANYYTLAFVPEKVNKLAYATSFGVSRIPPGQTRKARKFLKRIEHISVREQTGQKIVEELTGRKVPIVCDPTLLFTGEQWLTVQKEDPAVKQPYIFCYFLGSNAAHREFANSLKKKTGMQIVVLRHLDEYIPSDNAFGDISPFDIGPSEFLNLIRNAAFVCTDSFHGTAFSILYRKTFFTFRRFRKAGNQSTNHRIESLLAMLDLSDRLISGNEKPEDCLNKTIDYDFVLDKLGTLRKNSVAFLFDALEAGGCVEYDNNPGKV